jgi:hypothetical protein
VFDIYNDDEEQQLFEDRPIEFMVQPGDLPTITKLLGREIFDQMQRVKCHQDKCLLITKTFNIAERYLFQNLIVFQEQLQEKHAVSTPISYFENYYN